MPKKRYPADLVAQVHRLITDTNSIREVARVVGLPRSSVASILRQHPVTAPVPVSRIPLVPTVPPVPPQRRVLLTPWLCEPVPLPVDLDLHPTIHALYADAYNADPIRASELDVLRIAFDLPVPQVRAYLNVLAAERVRASFDLVDDDLPAGDPAARSTLPRTLWTAALRRLQIAFDRQEETMGQVRDRLLAVLPAHVDEDASPS
jgi:hypothetical protein